MANLPITTRVARRIKWAIAAALPGIALVVIMAAGLVGSIDALRDTRTEDGQVSWHAFANGKVTADISQRLRTDLPFAAQLATVARVTDWLATGDLGPRVRQGCDGWLFLTDELELYPGQLEALRFRAELVAKVARILRQRGIFLLVAPVPDKSRIEAKELCGLRRSRLLEGRLREFINELRQRHVETVDLATPLKALENAGYYRTDTHWNERGAKAASEAISAWLHDHGMAPPRRGSFVISVAPEQERVGDLIRLAGLDGVPLPFRPRGDSEAPSRIKQILNPDIGPFDNLPPPEIVVVGTSFSRRANFVPFLSLSLGAPVANMAKDNGGLVTAAAAYFANPAFTETPPRVVVWEIPERLLEEPLSPVEKRWAATLGSGELGLKEETDTASHPK